MIIKLRRSYLFIEKGPMNIGLHRSLLIYAQTPAFLQSAGFQPVGNEVQSVLIQFAGIFADVQVAVMIRLKSGDEFTLLKNLELTPVIVVHIIGYFKM